MINHRIRNASLSLGALWCLLLTAGCNPPATPESASANTPPATAVASPSEGTEAAATSDDEAKLAELETKLKESPSDAELKKQVAEVSYQVGHTMMLNPDLQPRVKYRGALKHFRRTLALNPGHANAAAEKQQIEDVYKSMGMPVPQ